MGKLEKVKILVLKWLPLVVVLAITVSILTWPASKSALLWLPDQISVSGTVKAYIQEKYGERATGVRVWRHTYTHWNKRTGTWFGAQVSAGGESFTVHCVNGSIYDNRQGGEIYAALVAYYEDCIADLGLPAPHSSHVFSTFWRYGEQFGWDDTGPDMLFTDVLYTGDNFDDVYTALQNYPNNIGYVYCYTEPLHRQLLEDIEEAYNAGSAYYDPNMYIVQLTGQAPADLFAQKALGELRLQYYAPYIEYAAGLTVYTDYVRLGWMYTYAPNKVEIAYPGLEGMLLINEATDVGGYATIQPAGISQQAAEIAYGGYGYVPVTPVHTMDKWFGFLYVPVEVWQAMEEEHGEIQVFSSRAYKQGQGKENRQYGEYYVFYGLTDEFWFAAKE